MRLLNRQLSQRQKVEKMIMGIVNRKYTNQNLIALSI